MENEKTGLSRRSFLLTGATTVGTALMVRSAEALTHPARILEAEIVEDETLADVCEVPRQRRTRLEVFLKSRGIKPAHLARECGYSRQHLLRVGLGRTEPTRRCMDAIMAAIRRITRRKVQIADLFEVNA